MKQRGRSLLHKLKIDTHAAWLAARDPRCPRYARAFGLIIAAYALSPIDLIPDFIPVIGLIDDVLIIPAGIWLFVRMLPAGLFDQHRATAEAASQRPASAGGAMIVVAVWGAAAILALWLWGSHFA